MGQPGAKLYGSPSGPRAGPPLYRVAAAAPRCRLLGNFCYPAPSSGAGFFDRHASKMKKNPYRTNLWPGERPGTYCYEVVNPEGKVTIRGARRGSRAEVRAHVNKFLRRAMLEGGYQPVGLQ